MEPCSHDIWKEPDINSTIVSLQHNISWLTCFETRYDRVERGEDHRTETTFLTGSQQDRNIQEEIEVR